MEEFEKWLNEQKKNPSWETLGVESKLYQAWVSGAMNQAAKQEHVLDEDTPHACDCNCQICQACCYKV